ncbi:MAG: hypothetical protein WBQ21_12455 [Solirubrobacteraceae bacterium]
MPARKTIASQASSRAYPVEADTGAGPARGTVSILGYLDLVFVVLATPVALLLGAPAVGVVVGAGAWLTQHLVASASRRWIAERGSDARFGLSLVDAYGRIWLLAGAIVLAAVIGGHSDGLAAALMIFAAYSVAFALRLVGGRPQGATRR